MVFPTTFHTYLHWRYNMHRAFLAECIIPKIKTDQTIRIGTHNEVFHADEVMAMVMMRSVIGKLGGECTIHRIDRKDQDTLDSMDVLLDVGRELDPANGRFDHHQFGGTGYRVTRWGQTGLPFSTCGLVWHAVGLVLTDEADNTDVTRDDPLAFSKVDRELVQGIDASDSGAKMPNGYQFDHPSGEQKAMGSPMHLSKILGMCNSGDIHDAELQFQKFNVAMDIAQTVLENVLKDAKTFACARPKLEYALKNSCHESGILVLEEHIRWSEHISQTDRRGDVKIVVAPVGGTHQEWNVCIVRRHGNLCIPGAPKNWRGLVDKSLREASGIEGLTFCHASGHLMRAASKEAACKVAKHLIAPSFHRRVA